jgi:S1-C subfamily serine protease
MMLQSASAQARRHWLVLLVVYQGRKRRLPAGASMSADDALAVLQRLHDSGALAAIEQQHATAETDDSRPAKRSRSSPPSATAGAAAAGAAAIPQLQDDGRWSEVLKRCSKAVVVIRCARVRAFDACEARFGHATGFVVDKRRGLILTNRHVVTDGPVTADAIFLSKEEVGLTPFYRDPIHDFAFFRFNPHEVQHQELEEIALNPRGARVGTDVRVVGNDAGEKLSILSGTIARLDRAAPNYGLRNYNDFNTFYLGAASNTSGGSSGSPVLAIDGSAIGLNAGAANKAASSYYLPVDRVVVALTALQRAIGERLPPTTLRPTQAVPRGCMQAVFKHLPFDECRRLGLSAEAERGARHALPEGSSGLLVVEQLIRGSPAEGKLMPGDILLQVDGNFCESFLSLEAALDDAQAAGAQVSLDIERGGEPMAVVSDVVSLHSLTPSTLLEVSGAVFHPLTLQQARHYNIPIEGVYLAHAGYMFSMAGVVAHSLICAIGGRPVANLAAVSQILQGLADGERSTVRPSLLSLSSLSGSLAVPFPLRLNLLLCLRTSTL